MEVKSILKEMIEHALSSYGRHRRIGSDWWEGKVDVAYMLEVLTGDRYESVRNGVYRVVLTNQKRRRVYKMLDGINATEEQIVWYAKGMKDGMSNVEKKQVEIYIKEDGGYRLLRVI